MDDPEFTKAAVELASKAIEHALSCGDDIVKKYLSHNRARDTSTYAKYINARGKTARLVRNFVYQTNSADIYQIYIHSRFREGDLSGNDLIRELVDGKLETGFGRDRTSSIVITGSAGSGKSLFMKHAFSFILQISGTSIPVLIEARNFNRVAIGSMETRIQEELQASGVEVTKEQVTIGLLSGLFILLIDGIDELKKSLADHYMYEIQTCASKYSKCKIMASSRPMSSIDAWVNFSQYRLSPMQKSDAKMLIQKINFDASLKNLFISNIDRLFLTHYEFISIPLLCMIMLITFSNSGKIAAERHEFLEDAFDALWAKHDGTKLGFERHRYSKLERADFLRILSAFSISSFISGDFSMRRDRAIAHFARALALTGVPCKESAFFKDATISTSLLVQEGNEVKFFHRYMHEYFSAVFICAASDSHVALLVDDVIRTIETDAVIPLAFSMRRDKIEQCWVLPRLERLWPQLDPRRSSVINYARYAAGDPLAKSTVPDMLAQIRTLYGFKPTSDQLRAAYDAVKHLKRTENDDSLKPSVKKLFIEDFTNFAALLERLKAEYSQRLLALDQLMGKIR